MHAIHNLELVLAHDAEATLQRMTAEGWPAEAALATYRDWARGLIDSSIDLGACWRICGTAS